MPRSSNPLQYFKSLFRLWGPLPVLFLFEAAVFYSQLKSQITPFYPSGFDQASYYVQIYNLIENFKAQGWAAIFDEIFHLRSASSLLFNEQGVLFALAAGNSRTAIISVNLVYFCALQLALFATIRRRIGNADAAWLAIALLLAARSLFFGNAGIYAYQMDFCAFVFTASRHASFFIRTHSMTCRAPWP